MTVSYQEKLKLGLSHTSNSKGTVIFLFGGFGTRWYGDASDQTMATINTIRDEGYETCEIRWLGNKGWGTNNSGQGFKKTTSGTAGIINWIVSDIANNPEIVGATGYSGGANELAYALTVHNLEDILDAVVLIGGSGRIDLVALCQMDLPEVYTGVKEIVDYVMGWRGDGDYCTNISELEWVVQALQSESIITPLQDESRDFHYKKAVVTFIEGKIDIFALQGRLFYDVITSEKSWVELPCIGHGIPHYPDGAALIQETLISALEASD